MHNPNTENPEDGSAELQTETSNDQVDTAITWSLGQLANELHQALGILAVIEHDFSLSGANRLLTASGELKTIDAAELTHLLESGFVVPANSLDRAERYEIPEVIRQHLIQELRQAGSLTRMQLSNARQLLEQAESLRPTLESAAKSDALVWFDLEHDNLRTALGFLFSAHHDYLLRRLTSRTWNFWVSRNLLADGRYWTNAALSYFDPGNPDELEPELQYAAASIALADDDAQRARFHVTQGLNAAKAGNDDYWRSLLLAMSGQTAAREGQYVHALSLFQLVLKVIEPLAKTSQRAAQARNATLLAASAASFAIGNAPQSELFAMQARDFALADKDRRTMGQAGLLFSGFAAARGDRKAALAGYREAIPLLFECGDDEAAAEGFAAMAAISIGVGLAPRSAALLGAAEQLGSIGRMPSMQSSIIDRRAIRQALAAELGDNKLQGILDEIWGRDQFLPLLDQAADEIERALDPQPVDTQTHGKAPISRREIEVLKLVAEGKSDQQIADELFIARRTVNDHVGKILMKLDVQNRTGAVARGRDLGLI